jgi:choloylglycine hydrolase
MKKILFFIIFCNYSFYSFACTTFFLNDNGHYYFGRNYDWVTGNGMVMTNARNVNKTSAVKGTDFNWTSQYGNITFNQYGKEFPTGGMNEKGLVVELMWLDETKYPSADKRPAFDVLQWIQYH